MSPLILNLALSLVKEGVKAYKEAKAQDELDKLQSDPAGWFADRHNRVRDDNSTEASPPKPDEP